MKKVCPICGLSKPPAEYNRNRRSKDGLSSYCKSCSTRKKKADRQAKQGYYRDEVYKTNESVKARVLAHYGSRCRCGYEDVRALTVDSLDARSHKTSGIALWKWMIRNEFPPGFETICTNCREIKRHEEKQHQCLQATCRIIARPS